MKSSTNNTITNIVIAATVIGTLLFLLIALGCYSPTVPMNCDVRNGRCY